MAIKAPYNIVEEKIFNDIVNVPTGYAVYVDKGMNFVKFEKNGKYYRLSLKEIKK